MSEPKDEAKVDNTDAEGRQWRVRARGEDIRGFIVDNVGKHPKQISGMTAAHFGITRQAVNKHLQKLVVEKALLSAGSTRDKSYRLASLFEWQRLYHINPELAEDQAWSRDVAPVLGKLPRNVMDIWHFCFTEMFNNAIDHSGGSEIFVEVARTAADTQLLLMDNGVGIFKKIQRELNLLDERHAILELAKGKLTTDPAKHTGQGIFFTSRLVDSFDILSGGVYFTYKFAEESDWIHERPDIGEGTAVFMKLNNRSSRTDRQIFEQYTSGDDFGFTKTVVPVRLAQYGEDKLISRSQAKRLLARVDLFRSVLFDFEGVESIGQAFADEIFRVFARSHPELELVPINATPQVQQMINSARAQWAADLGGI
jgi:anti-sigma regulatory factor (Ser/Thr protein kinase)/biotin operon repressor